ncbi:uncharacterized protein LOC134540966 [Bacillus rossius redtenbacheri]|uniref:uncharacterized protein LOC134540966 n=1 Tax=Bacillus rossius redtenbacheri TaxID=93214 RepID=UPI002FDD4F65
MAWLATVALLAASVCHRARASTGEDPYLLAARRGCQEGSGRFGEAREGSARFGCARFHALAALEELLAAAGSSPWRLVGPLALVPSDGGPAADDRLLQALRPNPQHRLGPAGSPPLPRSCFGVVSPDEPRLGKKEVLLLMPLAMISLKALMVPVLLGVLFIKKLLVVGVMLLPTLLSWLKICKRPRYSWLTVHEPEEHPYHYHAEHETSPYSSYLSADDHSEHGLGYNRRRWRTRATGRGTSWSPVDAVPSGETGGSREAGTIRPPGSS